MDVLPIIKYNSSNNQMVGGGSQFRKDILVNNGRVKITSNLF